MDRGNTQGRSRRRHELGGSQGRPATDGQRRDTAMTTILKKLMIRGLVAAVAATGLAVPAAGRPAQATDPVTITQVIEFASAAYSLFKRSKSGGLTLQEAVARMITEVRRSEAAILNRMDELTVAEVRGCSDHALLEFVESQDFSLSLKQRFAQDVTGCITDINVRYDA